MKVFWAFMALLAIAAAVMLTTDLGSKPAATPTPQPLNQTPPSPPPATLIIETPADKPASAPTTVESPPKPMFTPPANTEPAPIKLDVPASSPETTVTLPTANPQAEKVEPKPEAPTAEPVTPEPKPETKPESSSKPDAPATPESQVPTSTEDENALIKLRQEIEAERAAAAAQKSVAAPAPPPVTPDPAPAGEPGLFGTATAEAKPDGSLLIDGKYIVKGKGTAEEPYKVTWDQLLSAERDYAPKDGKKTIPPRIQALHEKWVEITGYVAFPLMANETDELLSMMNQWDGCCIGIPPTPYDAIEVRLNTPVSGDGRLTTYGVIKGRFKIDPHLVGGWLVGLYTMDQAKLTPMAYGGVAP